jgi:hypothetical protein
MDIADNVCDGNELPPSKSGDFRMETKRSKKLLRMCMTQRDSA